MTDTPPSRAFRAAVAIFWAREAEPLLPTLDSLTRGAPDIPVVVGSPLPGPVQDGLAARPNALVVEAWSAAALVHEVVERFLTHVLLITDPVLVPPRFLERAVTFLDDDLRIASVPFLSNAAGYLSIPHRNEPVGHPTGGLDEVVVSRLLREKEPDLGRVVIPVPSGPVVLLSFTALAAVGALDHDGEPETVIADWSLRAQRRGFLAALDPSTYVLRPFDLAPGRADVLRHDARARHHLHVRYPFFPAAYDDVCNSDRSTVALAQHTAVAKMLGLRLFVDGTSLGPQQMGTQVQTLALIDALAQSDDVLSIGVALPGPTPRYALAALSHPKIRTTQSFELDFSCFGQADIVHRPFQPDRPLPFDTWASYAHRTVVTIQDLIAYQIGASSPTAPPGCVTGTRFGGRLGKPTAWSSSRTIRGTKWRPSAYRSRATVFSSWRTGATTSGGRTGESSGPTAGPRIHGWRVPARARRQLRAQEPRPGTARHIGASDPAYQAGGRPRRRPCSPRLVPGIRGRLPDGL